MGTIIPEVPTFSTRGISFFVGFWFHSSRRSSSGRWPHARAGLWSKHASRAAADLAPQRPSHKKNPRHTSKKSQLSAIQKLLYTKGGIPIILIQLNATMNINNGATFDLCTTLRQRLRTLTADRDRSQIKVNEGSEQLQNLVARVPKKSRETNEQLDAKIQ